ncbi:oxidoreductase [Halolactibacillus alkaliphilus]|uniref:Oxidoreductase n=1 Tax=Halolactibacillus alkaliphilus TaxID=442899 RepID=A0A511WXK2_9BACI|nr:Gfo/Idh/MocA family oxidoreductase [Halolactibacillus alkaliphilus]GEN55850.1 oxidoreductase [Halolactibacillus alkaliphilus]GGN65928.1 oxidoreductase [Halolactibacillus alkaliphilus]SFO66484.1 Predicted dehydrogenase [Halolactibacillus alkaliphilus]
MSKKDGMNYAPKGKSKKVVKPGEFNVAVTALDHGHIYGMTNGLIEAGATIKYLYEPDKIKREKYLETYPFVEAVDSLEVILGDRAIHMVAAAAIPYLRSSLGNKVMQSGKDYFTDKTGFTTLAQLEETKRVVKETGRRYFIYFSERLHVEAAIKAGEIIDAGTIGKVIQVTGFGPHRLDKENRPEWFFEKDKYGGVLADIGSHQIEQFLYYTGNKEAKVLNSKVANYYNSDKPELEDYGDATLVGENGATFYFKVDWLTPDGLPTWGDGRTFITGTKGTIELRKYTNVGTEETGDHLFLVTHDKVEHMSLTGKVGFPFFGQMILDSLNGTEIAMTQDHIFKAQELCLIAQEEAIKVH